MPWLAGMFALFAFEFVEGNTVTPDGVKRNASFAKLLPSWKEVIDCASTEFLK